VEDWRPVFYEMSTADNVDAKRKAFQRVRTELCNRGDATVTNDVYMLADPAVMSVAALFTKRDTGQERDTSGTSPGE
jgi:hypothetical protein